MRSCGIQEWDNQVLEIIKDMPRWTPLSIIMAKGNIAILYGQHPYSLRRGKRQTDWLKESL